ncbi:MAG: hypothetical protein Q6361_00710 [Candidatus Hermodarchaeota archaeon]|nr:hypothetical protein [Candidatus Hermodarchaeota archaeon]
MSEATDEILRLRLRVLAFWIMFFSVIAYILVTFLLVYQRGRTVQLTLVFAEPITDSMGIFLVVLYLTIELFLTWFFYRRALQTGAEKVYVYGLASVVIGVSAPYVYGLLLSFMGIMRDILPILYIVILYVAGMVVGIRIIPTLARHQYER